MAGLSASTYNFIASQTLGSAGTITFSNLPQSYTDLVIICNNVLSTSGTPAFGFQINGDTNGNYSATDIEGTGSSAVSARQSNQSYAQAPINSVGLNSSTAASVRINLMNYSSTNMYKTALWRFDVASGSASGTSTAASLYRSFNPVTSLTLSAGGANIASGAIFTLYGIKAADTTAIIPTKAFGGDAIVTDGTYTYHAFKNSGVFTTVGALTADVLVIGGGGSGGSYNGGGGGAGGVRSFGSQSLTASTAYTCTVGAGGAAPAAGSSTYNNGSTTTFTGLTASAGGGGGGWFNGGAISVGSGACGGGAAGGNGSNSTNVGTGSLGYNGGQGSSSGSGNGGGGGGGMGGLGGNAANGADTGGVGGVGITSSLINAIASVTNTGEFDGTNYYYAGGGGGGGANGPGSGGKGGGGKGSNSSTITVATSGLINSGGGGGGLRGGSDTGGAGGSGLIVVRYLS